MTESVRLQPGMDEAFSPGDPRICSVVLMSTSVECLMENSITSEGINGVSPWGSSASKYPAEGIVHTVIKRISLKQEYFNKKLAWE